MTSPLFFRHQCSKSRWGPRHRCGPVPTRDWWARQEPDVALIEGSPRSGEVPVRASRSSRVVICADGYAYSQAELTVTLQCSGTRRIEQIREYPGDGDELINAPWGEGAMYVLYGTMS